ncbi:MAG: hypothetical protein MUP52_12605, partial [Candidatus Aminicenantes bacterium]|nr:hypothetical protein [Candidatus Aminicenantes bacterium]
DETTFAFLTMPTAPFPIWPNSSYLTLLAVNIWPAFALHKYLDSGCAYSGGFRPGIPTESGHHSEGSRPLIPAGKRPLFGLSSERWPESLGKFHGSEADSG